MQYTCDIDVIELNVCAPSMEAVLSHIARDCVDYFKKPDLFKCLHSKLRESERSNAFITKNHLLIANTVIEDLDHPVHMFYRLTTPLFIERAAKPQYIKQVFTLISPHSDGPLHLRRLSRLSRLFDHKEFTQRLEHLNDADLLRAQFMYNNFEEEAA